MSERNGRAWDWAKPAAWPSDSLRAYSALAKVVIRSLT